MNRKAKQAAMIVIEAFYKKRFVWRESFLKAKKEIDHLEGDEFAEKLQEYLWPYQRESADLALSMAAEASFEAKNRVAAMRKDYSVTGFSTEPSQYMYPNYVFLLVYYALFGKQAKLRNAEETDANVMQMIKTWIRKWEFDLQRYGAIQPDPGEEDGISIGGEKLTTDDGQVFTFPPDGSAAASIVRKILGLVYELKNEVRIYGGEWNNEIEDRIIGFAIYYIAGGYDARTATDIFWWFANRSSGERGVGLHDVSDKLQGAYSLAQSISDSMMRQNATLGLISENHAASLIAENGWPDNAEHGLRTYIRELFLEFYTFMKGL